MSLNLVAYNCEPWEYEEALTSLQCRGRLLDGHNGDDVVATSEAKR